MKKSVIVCMVVLLVSVMSVGAVPSGVPSGCDARLPPGSCTECNPDIDENCDVVTADSQDPTVSFTLTGTFVDVTAADNREIHRVQLFVNGYYKAENDVEPYDFDLSEQHIGIVLVPGDIIKVVVSDTSSRTAEDSYTVPNPNGPTVSITSTWDTSLLSEVPAGSDTSSAVGIVRVGLETVEVIISEGDATVLVEDVIVLIDNVPVNPAISPTVIGTTYSFDVDTSTLSPGIHTITVKATDADGNDGEHSATIFFLEMETADLLAISILKPQNNAQVTGQIIVVAEVSDETGVDRVEFRLDSTVMCDTVTDTACGIVSGQADNVYEWGFDTTAKANANYELTAKVYDDKTPANTVTSLPVMVTVANSATEDTNDDTTENPKSIGNIPTGCDPRVIFCRTDDNPTGVGNQDGGDDDGDDNGGSGDTTKSSGAGSTSTSSGGDTRSFRNNPQNTLVRIGDSDDDIIPTQQRSAQQQPARPQQPGVQPNLNQQVARQPPQVNIPPPQPQQQTDDSIPVWLIIVIGVGGLVVIGGVTTVIVLVVRKGHAVPDSVKSYVQQNLQRGYKPAQLRQVLVRQGWDPQGVDKVLKEFVSVK